MAEERRNALAPGTELEGYRFDSILGAGGFGVTYRATEILLNRSVAIKEFLPAGMVVRDADGLNIAPIGATEAGDFEWGMDRFRQEAQTLVAFRHPNIVSVLRYFETNGTGYLVMEFVEGRTLAQLLQPNNVLDEDEIREILDPLLDGLEAVHAKGFLHRDIKPANIFIREDGSPVLIDFGAARMAMGHHSKSLTSIISAGYAPYEQYDSTAKQGAWTDIYALGGVLYRCVTGRLPAEAPARVTAVFGGGADPMASAKLAAKSKCSPALLATIDGALGIREGDRLQTVAAFRETLKGDLAAEETETAKTAIALEATTDVGEQQTLLAGAPAAKRRPAGGSISKSSKSKRSMWKVAVPVSLVLILVVGAGAWSIIANQKPSRENTSRGDDNKVASKAAIISARYLSECRWAWNGKTRVGWKARIEACTAIIGSKTLSGPRLAAIYYYRSLAKFRSGARTLAKYDIETAISIDPDSQRYRIALKNLALGRSP